jgi:transcriptional regulator with XRE-family HTH domain/tetratricopeptide (TPR) repeat protein
MMASSDAPFGSLLRRYRNAAGLTQEELAERAGVSPRAVSALERGARRTPHRDTAKQLARALNLSTDEQERFLASARRAAVVAAPAVVPAVPRRLFVGRSAEYQTLERHLAGEGPPVAMLAGEPGIGKSRLLQELIPAAARHGLTVLEGGCQRRRGEEPYTPLLEALARHIELLSPSARRTALAGCAWLVRLMPELAETVPSLEPGQERRLVFAAVARFLDNIAGSGGTLLLLDDLQWASIDALDLLASLAALWPRVPLRIVGAYRDTEVGSDDPLAVTLADLAHRHLVNRIPIGPLSPEAAIELLDSLLPDLPRTEVERRVLARGGGVPFFLVSCAQGMRSGFLDGRDHDVPWDVAQSIRQRVAALPAEAREVLGAAAVIGRTIPLTLLLAVAGHDEDAVLDAIDAAQAARLLEEAGPADYRFAHDVIGEVIDADLGAGRRTILHRRTAQALERTAGEASVEAIAYHYDWSDDHERAALWLERAGDRAAAMYANAEAINHYDRARHHIEVMGAPSSVLAHLGEKMGIPLYLSGQFERAFAILSQSLAIYRTLGTDEQVRVVGARLGKAYFESGRAEEGLRVVEPLLDRTSTSRGAAELSVTLAHLLWRTMRYAESLTAAEQGAAAAEAIGDRRLLAEAELRRGSALWKLGDWQRGQAALARSAAFADETGDLETTSRTWSNLGDLVMFMGEFDEARRCLQRALEAVERRSGPSGIIYQTTQLARLAFITGDWRQARTHLEYALQIVQTFSHGWVSLYPRLELARLDVHQGRWESIAREIDDCRQIAEQRSDPQALDLAGWILAELDLLQQRPEAAAEKLRAITARPTEEVYRDLTVGADLIRADVALGHAAAAAQQASRLVEQAEACADRLHLADLLCAQAAALAALDQRETAEETFHRAVALAHEIGCPFLEARALYHLAHSQQPHDPPAARQSREAAHRIFTALGAVPWRNCIP